MPANHSIINVLYPNFDVHYTYKRLQLHTCHACLNTFEQQGRDVIFDMHTLQMTLSDDLGF